MTGVVMVHRLGDLRHEPTYDKSENENDRYDQSWSRESLDFKPFSNSMTTSQKTGQKAPLLRELRGVVVALLRNARKRRQSVTGRAKS